jgi:hypothetical protein
MYAGINHQLAVAPIILAANAVSILVAFPFIPCGRRRDLGDG